MLRSIDHFIGGSSFASGERPEGRIAEVFDPNQGQVQAHVRLGTAADLQKAVDAAKAAQPAWAATNPQRRARVMFKFRELVEKNMDDLAHLLSSEHGKVLADARGDVQRGLEVIEYACGIPQALKGEYTVGAGPGIDVYSMRQPLGIGAGITPFNFPAMIPMWMFGMAIACGNAFIVKPSERDPSVPNRLAELMKDAGLPDGILNVVHGDKEMVDAILDHPDIAADQLRRLVGYRSVYLRARHREQQARPGVRRRQEPRHRHARRRPRPGRQRPRRRSLRLGRRALHGAAGRRAGRRRDRRSRSAPSSSRRSRAFASASRPTRRRIMARWSARRTRSGSSITSRWASTRAPSWSSTAAASCSRGTRKASSSARPSSTM